MYILEVLDLDKNLLETKELVTLEEANRYARNVKEENKDILINIYRLSDILDN